MKGNIVGSLLLTVFSATSVISVQPEESFYKRNYQLSDNLCTQLALVTNVLHDLVSGQDGVVNYDRYDEVLRLMNQIGSILRKDSDTEKLGEDILCIRFDIAEYIYTQEYNHNLTFDDKYSVFESAEEVLEKLKNVGLIEVGAD